MYVESKDVCSSSWEMGLVLSLISRYECIIWFDDVIKSSLLVSR